MVQRIFLSYGAADNSRVAALSNWLLEQGFELSRGNVAASATEDLLAVIRKADFFLACLTQNSLDRRGKNEKKNKSELDLLWDGTNNEAFLISVRLEACLIPETLMAFPFVDVFKSEDIPALLDQMRPVIERRRKPRAAFPGLTTGPETIDAEEVSDASRESPSDPMSQNLWRVELLRLLAGERDYSVEKLGGVEAYIEVNIAEADDP